MFFGKQSFPATPGKSAPRQNASRPPVVISLASSLAPSSATSAVATLPAKSGLFSKWQRSSGTSSASSVSINEQAIISELRKKNAILVDHNDGLMQAHQLNQETVQKLAADCLARDKECTQLRDSNSSLKAQLEFATQETQDQTAALQAELHNLTASRDEAISKQASLQRENDTLATLIAASKEKGKKYEEHTSQLMQQVHSYTKLSAQQQQSSKDQVDAIHAQQLQMEQRTKEQLQTKDTSIRQLQAQLKHLEADVNKATVSRGDEIATLSVQLKRSDIERNTQAQLANEWQDLSNVHHARVLELEEQVKQLLARSA